MRKLARLARRIFGRLRSLSPSQASALAVVTALAAGVATVSVAGLPTVAISLLAVLVAVAFAAVVHMLMSVHRANRTMVRDLRTIADLTQRRVVAAVEKDRLARADRHQALLDVIERNHRQVEHVIDRLQPTADHGEVMPPAPRTEQNA